MNLIITPLILKSLYPSFTGATPIEKAGEFESAQTNASFCTLDIACKRIFIAVSSP
jgi:hypothetical protein